MKLFISVAFLCLFFSELHANPVVLKEADNFDSIFTAVLIKENNKRIFVIDCIIKGSISQKAFIRINAKSGLSWINIGDRCVFRLLKDGKISGLSPIENGYFSWVIDGKLQRCNIDVLIKRFEPK